MGSPSIQTTVILAKRVLGVSVTDPRGRKIGRVVDLVLDPDSNKILFAVVRVREGWSSLKNRRAVVWSALNFDLFQNSYVMEVTEAQLRQAPTVPTGKLLRQDMLQTLDRAADYYKGIGVVR